MIFLNNNSMMNVPKETYQFVLKKSGKIYFGFKLFLVYKFFDPLFHLRNRRLAKFADIFN